jgi:hypothetical protein
LSDEQRVLEDSLRYQLDYFASNPGAANKMITQGETPADSAIEARQLAAYAAVGSLLLNLDEAVTKE